MRLWLKTAREKKELTMKMLADKLNISESYYCSIENGERQKKMDLSLAAKLSVALDMPIVEIIENELAMSDGDAPEGVSA